MNKIVYIIFLDSMRSEECINFTMMSLWFFNLIFFVSVDEFSTRKLSLIKKCHFFFHFSCNFIINKDNWGKNESILRNKGFCYFWFWFYCNSVKNNHRNLKFSPNSYISLMCSIILSCIYFKLSSLWTVSWRNIC